MLKIKRVNHSTFLSYNLKSMMTILQFITYSLHKNNIIHGAEKINVLYILPKRGRSWVNPFTHENSPKRIIARRHMIFEPNRRS